MTTISNQEIHLHCLLDSRSGPLRSFFSRYRGWVDEFHFWDAGTSSERLDEARTLSKGVVYTWDDKPVPGSAVASPWFDRAWKVSQGTADWVLLVHSDEHLHHPDLREYLRACTNAGITAVRAIGYELLVPSNDDGVRPWHEQATLGLRNPQLDRLCVLNPNALTETRFAEDLLHSWPEGHVVWPESSELLILHFGSEPDPSLQAKERPIPGLGDLSDMPPGEWRGDEKTVERSGLFDANWYLAQYPDVRTGAIDPLVHFCQYGWREGRQPNPYFDVSWYAGKHATEIKIEENPLVHYVHTGEALDYPPSPHFDPAWYRQRHGLPAGESPLRHYLLRRLEGVVSPLPSFDLADYLTSRPELKGRTTDWYLHAQHEQQNARSGLVGAEHLTWSYVASQAGGNPDAGAFPAQVSWSTFQAVVSRFLPLMPFDADWYLSQNPDVAAAVQEGSVASAHGHFIQHGYFEGRSPVPPIAPH